jgi:hypothetical protein
MKCIICTNEFEKLTNEHIFPESMGGSIITKNVCKSCHSKLGQEVDCIVATFLCNCHAIVKNKTKKLT